MLRTIIAGLILLVAVPTAARAQDWIYIYQDGEPVGYLVGNDFEFYEVDHADIVQGNMELMAELAGYGPHTATVGYGVAQKQNAGTALAEFYKPRPDGVQVSGVSIRDYLSPGDWQAVYGDFAGARSWYTELDKSGVHWSWDSTSFDTAGHVYGLEANDDNSPRYVTGDRERYQTDFIWRRGTMDGSAFRIRGLAYETNIRDGGAQPIDVKLKRMQGDFRSIEHGYSVAGALYGGKYVSNRLQMDNTFAGAKLEVGHWISPNIGVFADGALTQFDLGGEDAGATRSNLGGNVVLTAADISLTGFGRMWQEDTDFAANSHLRGYDDLGARLEYRPSGDFYLTAGYRKREVDAERLRLEAGEAYDGLFADPAPTRKEWASLRQATSAASDRFDFQGRVKLAERLYLGANYVRDDWDELPVVGNLNGTTNPSYFADLRTQKSAQLTYDLWCNGRFTLRSEELERENSQRLSNFSRVSHALNYSGSLCRKLRWGAGVSRTETGIDLAGETQDWDADSWSYDFSLNGQGGIGDYRFSYRRQDTDGASGGSYDSLGLELTLEDLPISLAAWWRERADALGGAGNFDDTGISLGYHISIR